MMKVNENIRNWYNNGGKEKIAKYVKDEAGIFSSPRGEKAGVYAVYVLTPAPEERKILMYIGEVGRENRGFRDRLVEHMKYWIENPEHYAGLKLSELMNGYKYSVCILAEEANYELRYAMEQSMIEEFKPYIQFNCYPKYETEYRGNDLAIFPTYRRRAFLVARDGKYIEEKKGLFVDNIYKLLDKVDLNDYRTVIPDQQIVDLVEKEMPNGSEVCASVKKFVETKLGIVSKRGCRYSYLIKIVAAVLETVYKADYTIVECHN